MDEMEERAGLQVITKGTRSVLFSVEVSWGVSACVRAYRNIGKRNISFPTVKSALLLLFDISTYS